MTVFGFKTYEAYLKHVIDKNETGRGYKSRLAEAAGVHPSYVTRLLDGTSSLTPDQAAGLCEFWHFDFAEREYFTWLVLKGRAGSAHLREIANARLEKLKEENDELARELPAEQMEVADTNEYYLNWNYSAIHVLATLKKTQTVRGLAERLGLPLEAVKASVSLLSKMGLIEVKAGGVVTTGRKNVHLSNQNWMAPLQHRNWRIAATERIGRAKSEDLNYTGVHSLSEKDLAELRSRIREFLVQTDRLIRPSPEETACVLAIDLFEI